MKTFTKIQPTISVPLFYAFMTISLVIRYIFGTITGAFLLLIAIYLYLKHYCEVQPLSWQELIIWVDSLDKEYKIGVLSSVVTIVGFVVAFYTATLNWKSQMRAELKFMVSGEIEEFFARVSSDITTARIYAELLINSVKDICNGCSLEEAQFNVQYIQQQNSHFLAVRERLSGSSVEIHRLLGKNFNVLSTGWRLVENLQDATKSFLEITDKMWINVPIIDVKDPNRVELLIKYVDVEKCDEFVHVCNSNFNKINALSGSIRGYLISPIVGLNIFSLFSLLSIKGEFYKVIKELYLKK